MKFFKFPLVVWKVQKTFSHSNLSFNIWVYFFEFVFNSKISINWLWLEQRTFNLISQNNTFLKFVGPLVLVLIFELVDGSDLLLALILPILPKIITSLQLSLLIRPYLLFVSLAFKLPVSWLFRRFYYLIQTHADLIWRHLDSN